MRVDVWSDIACPWCWVGKRHLEAALAQFDATPVEIVWRAFELDPSAPRRIEGEVDYVGRLASKYGTTRVDAQGMIDRMTQTGAERGLEFRFDRVKPVNTFDAHRLLAWAKTTGPEPQNRLKERLFVAYMSEGLDLGDPQTLVELAAAVDLSADRAQSIVTTDEFADEVRQDEALAGKLGITGVPLFAFASKYAVPGAQPPEVLLDIMNRAWELVKPPRLEAVQSAGPTCGPDGC